MYNFLHRVNDSELVKLLGQIIPEMEDDQVTKLLKSVIAKYPQYDETLLWLLMYHNETNKEILHYIDSNYKKFHKIYDAHFIKKLVRKNGLASHLWEMILCDIVSECGEVEERKVGGSDFLLHLPDGQAIQVEATVTDEAVEMDLRSRKPDFSINNYQSQSGNVDDLEKPIMLRFVHAFDKKAKKENYNRALPLIIAINTYKAVGFTSNDAYVLRRVLFGLGSNTIARRSDDTYSYGLEVRSEIKKEKGSFVVGRFLDPDFSHISGVIYTSQQPYGLIPGGSGWYNYGITYVSNPNATNPANIDFKCMRKIILTDQFYLEEDAESVFESTLGKLF